MKRPRLIKCLTSTCYIMSAIVFVTQNSVLPSRGNKILYNLSFEKCSISRTLRIFADVWPFHTYKTAMLFHFNILSIILLLAFITVAVSMVERYICVVFMFSCPSPRLMMEMSLPMSRIELAHVWRAT